MLKGGKAKGNPQPATDNRQLKMLHPADGGMVYTETNLSHRFPEPLNTITSGFFFILALYWIFRLKGFSKHYSFLSIASWILLIGSIGGTFYHDLRRYPVFIMMDWLPISTNQRLLLDQVFG